MKFKSCFINLNLIYKLKNLSYENVEFKDFDLLDASFFNKMRTFNAKYMLDTFL